MSKSELCPSAILELVKSLRQQVQELSIAVAELQLKNEELTDRVKELEDKDTSSSDHYELVSNLSSAKPVASVPAELPLSSASSYLEPERIECALQIGAWLRRSLAGLHRGSSGRDKIKLQNKIYVVVRDKNNRVHNPPLIFYSWVEAKNLVWIGRSPGESIFVGLPSSKEAKIAISAADLELPSALVGC